MSEVAQELPLPDHLTRDEMRDGQPRRRRRQPSRLRRAFYVDARQATRLGSEAVVADHSAFEIAIASASRTPMGLPGAEEAASGRYLVALPVNAMHC
jgi:hypothetical protein